MADVVKFQKMLLEDEAFRKRFAEDPRAVTREFGIELPEGVTLPERLDPEVVDRQADMVREGLSEMRASIDEVDFSNSRTVGRVIDESIPLRGREIAGAMRVHDELTLVDPGGQATVAVVGAVVAAVVAVPVAAVGASDRLTTLATPPAGRLNVSRGIGGLTLQSPDGTRVDGLTADDATRILRDMRR